MMNKLCCFNKLIKTISITVFSYSKEKDKINRQSYLKNNTVVIVLKEPTMIFANSKNHSFFAREKYIKILYQNKIGYILFDSKQKYYKLIEL